MHSTIYTYNKRAFSITAKQWLEITDEMLQLNFLEAACFPLEGPLLFFSFTFLSFIKDNRLEYLLNRSVTFLAILGLQNNSIKNRKMESALWAIK